MTIPKTDFALSTSSMTTETMALTKVMDSREDSDQQRNRMVSTRSPGQQQNHVVST